ncbi:MULTISPECIES: hypothetical protein [unclassified Bradyrhizobium]|uniref:hypothetical protein n=2 Tax=unclassified Bradyrhizobium TaxID=2631580 RepID=UPI0028EF605E|nr:MULTISPECIES: hypothetical protein [unclassified Bradyrhizobium]
MLRLAILILFATFGRIGFGRSLAALLWMTMILCAMLAVLRRKGVFAAGLNHWDEMIGYTALFCATMALIQSSGNQASAPQKKGRPIRPPRLSHRRSVRRS